MRPFPCLYYSGNVLYIVVSHTWLADNIWCCLHSFPETTTHTHTDTHTHTHTLTHTHTHTHTLQEACLNNIARFGTCTKSSATATLSPASMFTSYNRAFSVAMTTPPPLPYRLLKDKRQMDDSFNSFLELRRGAAMHTLESLMLLPVSHPLSPSSPSDGWV